MAVDLVVFSTLSRLQRIGSQMLTKFREETDAAVDAVRASANSRFQEVVDEASRLVNEEFEAIMQAIEDRRRVNEQRMGRLREQLASVTAQLDAVRRVQAMQAAFQSQEEAVARRGNLQEEAMLQQLKQRVRFLWQQRDEMSGGLQLPSQQRATIEFLSRSIKSASYSQRLFFTLKDQLQTLRERARREDEAALSHRTAVKQFADAAHRMTGGRAIMQASQIDANYRRPSTAAAVDHAYHSARSQQPSGQYGTSLADIANSPLSTFGLAEEPVTSTQRRHQQHQELGHGSTATSARSAVGQGSYTGQFQQQKPQYGQLDLVRSAQPLVRGASFAERLAAGVDASDAPAAAYFQPI